MTRQSTYAVPASFVNRTHINAEQYQRMYQQSIEQPEQFWAQQAEQRLSVFEPWTQVRNSDLAKGKIEWFTGAKLNVAYNCIDRHLPQRAEQTALIMEANQTGQSYHITYAQLHDKVRRFANVLKRMGVQKGDRVCVYMPMVEEAVLAMLACARIGAIHSVVFAGFSPDALCDRIEDAQCEWLVTANMGERGDKLTPIKEYVDKALAQTDLIKQVLLVKATEHDVNVEAGRDVWYHDALQNVSNDCPCEPMDAEDPLFILYTSGSTGKPKGVLHSTAGYLLYVSTTFQYTFDYQEGEVFWCTADVGWVTGHSYCVYAPLANGGQTLIFGGVPNYPDAGRFWQVCDEHQVNIFYTAPTAIRALMREGDDWVTQTSRNSLRVLGTVGEPINPDVWEWYHRVVGEGRCPIVDTWWQTETGGHMITALPGATTLKPGSATRPFFGIQPVLLDADGQVLEGEAEGLLMIAQDWPGMMRTVYGNHQRFVDTYLSPYPNYYFTGDGARRDADGDYWITGRVDDVLNVSGHRLGTAEVESALIKHEHVAEAAVVGYPHDIKGQGIYAYITLMAGCDATDALKTELIQKVRTDLGAIVTIDCIQWAPSLPKTRSGKIMRRILRKIASHEVDSLGDTSTLAEPQVVQALIDGHESLNH